MQNPNKEQITDWFKQLQDSICNSLEELDGSSLFIEDLWKREEGGGGRSRATKNGDLIEKGGVNFSAVSGDTPSKILEALKLPQSQFFATGVSIVLHPKNPWVPIIHMNIRYFEMSNGIHWFGGGIDLTPHTIIESKATEFHQTLMKACDKYSKDYYTKFKKWADDYFYIPHRNETRGVGGIFFDRLEETNEFNKIDRWNFVKEIGETFIPIYTQAVNELRDKKWSKEDKEWQKIRRGRYVEFNLVHDKGTKFGLDTNGRTESILMSMPPDVSWEYQHSSDTENQKKTLELLKKGIDWVNA